MPSPLPSELYKETMKVAEQEQLEDFYVLIEKRFSAEQVRAIKEAYQLANESHQGQYRKSGDPYITHPVAVATLTVELNLDHLSVMAALLHDVIEDTAVTREDISSQFGEEVAHLVDGLSKLTHLHFQSKAEAQAANFQKMVLAMADDIRVVLIKLSDRLHNMRTLDAMSPDKRRRIGKETLDIYAPIASRLGITRIKNELEDLGFKALYPARWRVLGAAVKGARNKRRALVEKVESLIASQLKTENIHARVNGREKHLYSLYLKMRSKQLSFQEVYDMFAVRIITDTGDNCYRTLGVLHSLYKPIPGHFEDHIAIPKANGYQSLHTVVSIPPGIPAEIQIRTEEMNHFAESGIAARWVHKVNEEGDFTHARTRKWLKSLLDMQETSDSSVDFFENVKVDLFPDEIYVFTPKGDILQLPANATSVDFAYAIHSQIGNTCVAAKINRQLAPLNTTLVSGQTVEIITSETGRPSPLWLNFIVTAKARAEIRHYLKNKGTEEAAEFGKRLLNRELSQYNQSTQSLNPERYESVLEEFQYSDIDNMLIDIGLGNRLPKLIAQRLLQKPEQDIVAHQENQVTTNPLVIEGSEGEVVSFPRCCMPIPGDNIQGFLTAGKGIVIHRSGCKNVGRLRRRPQQWVPVEWSTDYSGEFQTNIAVELYNKAGVLARVASCISDMGCNIENITFQGNPGTHSNTNVFTLSVRSRKQLATLIRRLRHIPVVIRVRREL